MHNIGSVVFPAYVAAMLVEELECSVKNIPVSHGISSDIHN